MPQSKPNTKALRELFGSAVYLDASATDPLAVFEAVREFFGGTSQPVDDDPRALTRDDLASDGLLGVCVLPPRTSSAGEWIVVLDTAPPPKDGDPMKPEMDPQLDSCEWIKLLAEHCHLVTGADAFWYWKAGESPGVEFPMDGVGDTGWFTKGPSPKASHTAKGVAKAVSTFPHPFLHTLPATSALKDAHWATFRVNRVEFGTFLSSWPKWHRPKPAATPKNSSSTQKKTTRRKKASDVTMKWSPAAKRRVRALPEHPGPKPKPPTDAAIATLFDDALIHHRSKLKTFGLQESEVLRNHESIQRATLRAWKTKAVPKSASQDEDAALFLITARMLNEGRQPKHGRFETLVARLIATRGLPETVQILRRAWAFDREDLGKKTFVWCIPGNLFPRVSCDPAVWFRVRQWAAHADERTRTSAIEVAAGESDPSFRCAAALAFPTEPALWRGSIDALPQWADDGGARGHAAMVRLHSLGACATDLATAQELFSVRAMANTYEYPTVARALGKDGLAFIAAQRPTDPLAGQGRLLALTAYRGPTRSRSSAARRLPTRPARRSSMGTSHREG